MDKHRLSAIKARMSAATPGPWVTDHEFGLVLRGASQGHVIATLDHEDVRDTGGADLAFIAAAREDVEDLVAEVERLRDVIAGRTTPPTSTERVAHLRATGYDGRWRVRHGALDLVGVFHDSVLLANALRVTDARWWPLDAEGRPCAWPTAEVSR